jgi:hypothetical protein
MTSKTKPALTGKATYIPRYNYMQPTCGTESATYCDMIYSKALSNIVLNVIVGICPAMQSRVISEHNLTTSGACKVASVSDRNHCKQMK